MAFSHLAAVIVTLLCGAEGARRFRQRSDPGTTIVNGTDAPACKWKWQVGFYQSGSSSQPFCGGTIIASNWVVTAKHCVTSSNFDVMGGDILPGRGQRRSSAQVYTRSNADFALVRLSSGFNLDSCFNVPAMPSSEIRAGSTCWITGWGRLYNNGPGARTLQQAQTAVISTSECRRSWSLDSGDVCVLGQYNGSPTSACNGDSGGPLVCQVNGQWTLFGATSRGRSCNGISIYAGVYDALDWIRSYTGGSPTPSPTPSRRRAPTPSPSPGGGCVQEKDCSVSAWCNSDLQAWCQSNAASCPAPYCKRT